MLTFKNNQITRSSCFIVIGLFSLACTKPILDTLGQGATFFAAHAVTPGFLLGFVITLCFVLPCIVLLVLKCTLAVNGWVGALLYNLVVFLLLMLISLAALSEFVRFSGLQVILCAVVLSAITHLALFKISLLQVVVQLFSLTALLSPIEFLMFSPVHHFLSASPEGESHVARNARPIPIVYVVFDEFAPQALLDSSGEIDRVRFPSFARVAETFSYYPNTAGNHYRTRIAIPAMLSGIAPANDAREIPTANLHPDTLFTLLSETHVLNVTERISNLCPASLCDSNRSEKTNTLTFINDIFVVYQHIIYPKDLADRWLPDIKENWNNFAKDRSEAVAFKKATDELEKAPSDSGVTELNALVAGRRGVERHDIFNRFLSSITAEKSTLDFLHIVIPHYSWNYLPTGKIYEDPNRKSAIKWTTQTQADSTYHRYLVQLGYVDLLVGELIEELKRKDKYDDALIILTADHGIAFEKGMESRDITKNPGVLQVPLFVKYPQQTKGVRDTRYAQTIDILPTIADALGFEIPFPHDGLSLTGKRTEEARMVSMRWHDQSTHNFTQDVIAAAEIMPNRLERFGELTPLSRTIANYGFEELIGLSSEHAELSESASKVVGTATMLTRDLSMAESRSGKVSVLVAGILEGPGITRGEHFLGVTVNGVIVTALPVEVFYHKLGFSGLVPFHVFESPIDSVGLVLLSNKAGKPVVSGRIEMIRN